MADQDIAAEIARLERLRKKRTGAPGWTANVAAITKAIAYLKAQNGDA